MNRVWSVNFTLKLMQLPCMFSGEGGLCVPCQLAPRCQHIGWDFFLKNARQAVTLGWNWSKGCILLKLFRLFLFSPQIWFLEMPFPWDRKPITPLAVPRCDDGRGWDNSASVPAWLCRGRALSPFLHCQSSLPPGSSFGCKDAFPVAILKSSLWLRQGRL